MLKTCFFKFLHVRILACNPNLNQGCFTCGASWISGKYILTAAHCVEPDQTDISFFNNPTSNAYNNRVSGTIKTIKHHECWDFDVTDFALTGYDIMLLEADTDEEFDQPIRLSTTEQLDDLNDFYPSGHEFISYGFGQTSTGNNARPAFLQKTDPPVEYMRCDLLIFYNNRNDIMCIFLKIVSAFVAVIQADQEFRTIFNTEFILVLQEATVWSTLKLDNYFVKGTLKSRKYWTQTPKVYAAEVIPQLVV